MQPNIHADIVVYNAKQSGAEKEICTKLAEAICTELPEAENKLWHGHPVWFLLGNPIVGYSKEKKGIKLLFWSGSDFTEEKLVIRTGKFKDACVCYTEVHQIDMTDLARWLEKSRTIQWDYKNIVKHKGVLHKL